MTVSSLTPVNNYTGNGSVTMFDFDFLIESQEELVVTHTDKNGISNVLEFGIDYSINEVGNGNGSYISFPINTSKYAVLANDEILSLSLNLPIKQESEFANSSYLNLSVLERTFDYIVRILQILDRKIERSIKVQEGSLVTSDGLMTELKNAEKNASLYSSVCEEYVKTAQIYSEQSVKKADEVQNNAEVVLEAKDEIVQGNMYKYQLFDIVLKDKVLEFSEHQGLEPLGSYVYNTGVSGSRYGYPDFYSKCLEEKEMGTATAITLSDVTITVYVNENGHQFYDIADKEVIDVFYETYGIAWFYGVDTENERIFLPRNDYYFKNSKIENVGKYIEAGLPNITGTACTTENGNVYKSTAIFSGAFEATYDENLSLNGYNASTSSNYYDSLSFDASKSNSIYGNAETVQPPSVGVFAYMVVGNTSVSNSITNILDVTTTENDTIPLFSAHYFDFSPNNPSWLKAGTQANSGGIYTTCYQELVNVLNGLTKYGDLKVINEAEMLEDVDYSEYWKINQDEMYFITPTEISTKSLTGGVLGNGITIGLICGDDYAGIGSQPLQTGLVNSGELRARNEYYGLEQGTELSTSGTTNQGAFNANITVGLTDDTTKSGIIVEKSNAKLYFKVANVVQNLELLDVGTITETLVNKIDTYNTQWAVNACIPDYTAGIDVDYSGFEAPADGVWLVFGILKSAVQYYVLIDGIETAFGISGTSSGQDNSTITIPLLKGQTIKWSGALSTVFASKFYPYKGAN